MVLVLFLFIFMIASLVLGYVIDAAVADYNPKLCWPVRLMVLGMMLLVIGVVIL